MNSLQEKLLAAHIQYELRHWQIDNLEQTLKVHLQDLYQGIKSYSLRALIPIKALKHSVLQALQNYQPGKLDQEIINIAHQGLLATFLKDGLFLTHNVEKKDFVAIIKHSLALKNTRSILLHQVCKSDFYGRFITDILYRSIKSFWFGQNILTKNVPGASMLMDIGRNLVRKVPGVDEDLLDERVRSFLENNLKETIQDSEQVLNEAMQDDTAELLAIEIWQWLESNAPGEVIKSIASNDLSDLTELHTTLVAQVRQSGFLQTFLMNYIDLLYEKLGDLQLEVFLEQRDLKADVWLEEVTILLTEILAQEPFQSALQKLVTDRLSAFYQSDELLQLLS